MNGVLDTYRLCNNQNNDPYQKKSNNPELLDGEIHIIYGKYFQPLLKRLMIAFIKNNKASTQLEGPNLSWDRSLKLALFVVANIQNPVGC